MYRRCRSESRADKELGIAEEVGKILVLLVAQHLLDGDIDLFLTGLLVAVAALALDDHQRDAVNEQN